MGVVVEGDADACILALPFRWATARDTLPDDKGEGPPWPPLANIFGDDDTLKGDKRKSSRCDPIVLHQEVCQLVVELNI